MRGFIKRQKDERVQAEINKIYRAAYLVLMFGICFDLILQFANASFSGDGAFAGVRPVELLVFMAANFLSLILMVRKGIGDSSRYAEAETFPHGYYLGVSALTAMVSALISGALLCYHQRAQANAADLALMATFLSGSIFLLTMPLMYGLQYLCFWLAKRRRATIEREMEEDGD